MLLNANNLIVTMAAELLAEEEAELDAELTAKWLVFVKRTEKTEDAFKPKLRTAFTKQEKSVLGKLQGKRIPDTSDAEKAPARVGDEVEYHGKDGRIIQLDFSYSVVTAVHIKTLDEWRQCISGEEIRDIIIAKGSEEAEEAADKFADTIYTASAWQATFTAAMLPFVTQAYLEAGNAAFVEIGLEAAFNVTNPRARKFLKDRTFENVKGINEETRAKLKRVLVQAFDKGEGIPEISKRIAGVFDINRGSRTDKIARTEIVGASNNGTHQGYVDSEIVITEIWIDSRDSRVRTSPHNHALDGEEVALGKRFSNGLLHPHDPGGAAGNVINCRCTTESGKLKEAA